VRTLRDYLGNAFFPEHLDVLAGHLVEDVLVAETPQAVAAAQFILAEDAP
jgi:hypothetical protein